MAIGISNQGRRKPFYEAGLNFGQGVSDVGKKMFDYLLSERDKEKQRKEAIENELLKLSMQGGKATITEPAPQPYTEEQAMSGITPSPITRGATAEDILAFRQGKGAEVDFTAPPTTPVVVDKETGKVTVGEPIPGKIQTTPTGYKDTTSGIRKGQSDEQKWNTFTDNYSRDIKAAKGDIKWVMDEAENTPKWKAEQKRIMDNQFYPIYNRYPTKEEYERAGISTKSVEEFFQGFKIGK